MLEGIDADKHVLGTINVLSRLKLPKPTQFLLLRNGKVQQII